MASVTAPLWRGTTRLRDCCGDGRGLLLALADSLEGPRTAAVAG